MNDMPELTVSDFERAIPASLRKRLMRGELTSGNDVVALRRFIGLTQAQLASAIGVSVHTLRNWEQGRRRRGCSMSLAVVGGCGSPKRTE